MGQEDSKTSLQQAPKGSICMLRSDLLGHRMGKVMNSFPSTFQDWVTKHIWDLMAATGTSHATLQSLTTYATAAPNQTRTQHTSSGNHSVTG